MSSLKLIIGGVAGRMGQEVLKAATSEKAWTVVAGVDREKSSVKAETKSPVRIIKDLSELKSKDVDVIVDFSSPELFEKLLAQSVELKKPFVSGTTGLSDKQQSQLKLAAKKISVLWAPNMSVGIAIFCELIEQVAKLQDFDFQIEEFHHKNKVDRPSGTAILLQNQLKKNAQKAPPEPLSIRGGGIFGIHRLYAMSPDETLTIEHTALNRGVFARGALRAARWLVDQSPGLYRLKDTL